MLAFPAVPQTNSDANLNPLLEAVKAIEQNQLPRAESLLQSVLAKSPDDADALNLLGVIRAKQGRSTDAERLFRRAIINSPRHLGAHINLAELFLTTNRPTLATPILLNAHKLAPDQPDINLKLATVFADKGDYQQAHQYASRVPREAVSDDYFLVMLKSLIGLKRLDDARQLASEFAAFSAGKTDLQAEFAMMLARGGLNDEALNLLEVALRQTPGSFPLLYARGVINATLKRYGDAEEQLTSALAIKPDDVATLRALARVARATGNFEKSLSHLVRARRVAPNSPAVLYDFGVTTLQMDLLLDALPVFEQLHHHYPREPAYLYALAAVRWRKGETVETIRLMKSYVALQPRDASGFYLLGAALLRQELIKEAQAALQQSLSIKADPDTEYLIGISFEKAGNRAAAIDTFRRVVQSRPNHAAAHAALGAAYREAGSYAEARLELERAVELDSNDLRANYQLGLVYAKLGEKEAAKKMFARADDLRSRQRNQETVILKLIEAPQP
jgi:tetratricopeptide (TPR) repeat protein